MNLLNKKRYKLALGLWAGGFATSMITSLVGGDVSRKLLDDAKSDTQNFVNNETNYVADMETYRADKIEGIMQEYHLGLISQKEMEDRLKNVSNQDIDEYAKTNFNAEQLKMYNELKSKEEKVYLISNIACIGLITAGSGIMLAGLILKFKVDANRITESKEELNTSKQQYENLDSKDIFGL